MKKLYKLLNVFNIKLSTILIIIFSILFGNFKQMLWLFIIALIHECFHLLACLLLKIKIEKLTLLPFGAYLKVNDVENISFIKQIIIYIAGPLSMFFNLIWINLFYKYHFLNEINFTFLKQINFNMFIVNILPIYPLDGYMIIRAIIGFFKPYKKTLKLSYIISIITFLFFVLYNFISFQPMLTIFLLIEQIKAILKYKDIYKKFLINKSKFKKQKKFKIIPDYLMFKDTNNYKIENEKILNDSDIAIKELKNYVK